VLPQDPRDLLGARQTGKAHRYGDAGNLQHECVGTDDLALRRQLGEGVERRVMGALCKAMRHQEQRRLAAGVDDAMALDRTSSPW